MKVLVFRLEDRRCGLAEDDVVEVLPAASLTPLPAAPPLVEGLLNVRGAVVAVLDLRPRLSLPPKPLSPSDHLIVTRVSGRLLAIRVDRAESLIDLDPSAIDSAELVSSGASVVSGIAKLSDGLLLIHDPVRFLSEAETLALDQAIAGPQG